MMKVAVLLVYAVLTTRRVTCAAIHAPLDIISLDDITETDRRHLEYLNELRLKRSSEDAIQSLKASISQGIKSKLGMLAKGSASASARLSSGSSGYKYQHHDHPETYDHKSFDFWTLKKSILNTLLQAVKAIKGGVIAIKGQLIKGSGYLISAKGKLISAKGEAITNAGKNIAASAVLSPVHGHSDDYSQGHYHHGGPEEYGSPSAPGPEYEVPEHHYHHHSPHHEDQPDAGHSGILILKKIPVHENHDHPEHKVPDFKPVEHKEPSFGEIIGKFFSASTSLKPGVPAPFGDYDHHDHHHYHDDDHHSDHHDHHSDHHDHSSHEEYHHDHSSHSDSHEYSSPAHSSSNDHPKESSPFEEAPGFLNIAEYASETKGSPQTASQPPQAKPDPQKLQAASYDEIGSLSAAFSQGENMKTPFKYDEIRPLSGFSNAGFDGSFLSGPERPNMFVGSFSNKPNVEFPPLSSLGNSKPSEATKLEFGAFPNTDFGSDVKYLAPPSVGPQIFPQQNSFSNFNPHAPPQSVKYGFGFGNNGYPVPRGSLTRPTRSKNYSGLKRHRYPPPDFMKKVLHDFGPDRPKRL